MTGQEQPSANPMAGLRHEAAAVVPAAGASRRMGRPKLVLPWERGNVLEATIAALRAGGVSRLVVVRAPRGPLAAWSAPEGVRVAENPEPEGGMLSSVRCGLAALCEEGAPELLLVCPADLPALRPQTVRELVAAQRRHGGLVLPTHLGKRGHPLLVPARWLAAIDTLDETIGLRHLLRIGAADLLLHPVEDPGTVLDVDTPADYEDLRRGR
jgi:CTP:molybdopterin cytidylyltransferase MocA